MFQSLSNAKMQKDAKWKVNTPHCVLRVSWASRMAWNWWSSEAKPCRRPRRELLSTGLEIYGDSINSFNSAVSEFLLCSFKFFFGTWRVNQFHVLFFWRVNLRSGSKKQLMLSVAGIEKAKLDPLCKEAAAKEVHLTSIHRLGLLQRKSIFPSFMNW